MEPVCQTIILTVPLVIDQLGGMFKAGILDFIAQPDDRANI
jgi:hypothetical protein